MQTLQLWRNHCFQAHLTDNILEILEPNRLAPENEALEAQNLDGGLHSLSLRSIMLFPDCNQEEHKNQDEKIPSCCNYFFDTYVLFNNSI